MSAEAAARRAWLAKQDVPSWGAEVAALAEAECSEGVEVACEALSGEEEAKLAWMAKQAVPSWGAEVAAVVEAECFEGVEVACEALSGEEEAKLAWLAKQDSPSWGAEVAALAEARQHCQTPHLAVLGVGSCGSLQRPECDSVAGHTH